MMRFDATDRWRTGCAGATVACLVVTGVTNPERAPRFDERLEELERELRARYAGIERTALRSLEPFESYDRYYKTFGQNYHVLHQVESVALKGKPIPRRSALVTAVFAEELRSGLLTAMHDAAAIGTTVTVDTASGDEEVTLYNGKEVSLKPGDMYMRDEHGVLTSVILGPAAYGMARPETTSVAVCVYAPNGIDAAAVTSHLEAIACNMRLIDQEAKIELLQVISA